MSEVNRDLSLVHFAGVYRGFSPTDESDIVSGELEITIGEHELIWRMATGLCVQEERVSTTDFRPATREEVASQFKPGAPSASRAIGYVFKNGQMFLFFADPTDEEIGLMVRGNSMADILGPTILFSPAQVEKGLFDRAVEDIRKDAGDVLPMLRYGGKVKSEAA